MRAKMRAWYQRQLRRVKRVLLALVVLMVGYFFTPLYWLSEAVYWEALHQTPAEHDAIRWSIANRKAFGPSRGWERSFRGVILDGAERGRARDFTYRHDQREWWIVEGGPIPPVAHAIRNDRVGTWFIINARTAWWLIGYYTTLSSDLTGGAVFYKVTNHPSTWFAGEIEAGRMCRPLEVDAHTFYRLCSNGTPIPFP